MTVGSDVAPYRCSLSFFGKTCVYLSFARSDVEQVALLFRSFVVPHDRSSDSDLTILLSDNASKPFLRDITDPLSMEDRSIYYRDGNVWSAWNIDDTPIPPLAFPPLAQRFLVLHGCAAQVEGRTIAFCGPSFSGKSSLLLALVREGALAVSDDLVVIELVDKGDPVVWRYPKPVGVREPTLAVLPWLSARLDAIPDELKLSFPSRYGRPATTIVHLEDIFGHETFVEEETRILDSIWFLDRGFDGMRPLAPSDKLANILHNSCNSGLSRHEVAGLGAILAETVDVAEFGSGDLGKATRFLLSAMKDDVRDR